jgi:ubiquinone/menaquinone biosynthesis C-methylase UbiE
MVEVARDLSPELEFIQADAAELPFEDRSADLAIAFTSPMDV